MEKKQTAVEWLIYWMEQNQYFIGNDLLKLIKQAKEMEKEQIIEAHGIKENWGWKNGWNWLEQKTGEQYYNETYKSE